MPKLCQYLRCPYEATEERNVAFPEIDDRKFIVHVCVGHARGLDTGAPMAFYAYGVPKEAYA